MKHENWSSCWPHRSIDRLYEISFGEGRRNFKINSQNKCMKGYLMFLSAGYPLACDTYSIIWVTLFKAAENASDWRLSSELFRTITFAVNLRQNTHKRIRRTGFGLRHVPWFDRQCLYASRMTSWLQTHRITAWLITWYAVFPLWPGSTWQWPVWLVMCVVVLKSFLCREVRGRSAQKLFILDYWV